MSCRILAALAFIVAFAAVAEARNPSLRLPSFTHLQDSAVESVDITFGRVPLRIAPWFIGKEDPEDERIGQMLKGIRSLSVCHYRFDSDFVYSAKDLEGIRAQLSGEGWSPIVQVRDRKKDEDVDVFISVEGDKVNGIAIVASEPREFTIVNLVGSIDLDQIDGWRAHFESRGHRDWLPDEHTAGL